MPESAEVRRLSHELAAVVGLEVTATRVLSGRYMRTPIAGFSQLKGYRLMGIDCKGKLLFFHFRREGALSMEVNALSTLGMTGWWYFKTAAGFRETKAGSNDEFVNPSKLKHARLSIELGDLAIVFTDPRNFGTFKLVTNAGLKKKVLELGPDIAKHTLLPADFWPRFERFGKKKTIAEVLLDQRVFCGVGNYIRADAMYHAGVDPRVMAHDLSKRELGQLWNSCYVVANAAYYDQAVGKSDRFFYNVCYGQTHDEHNNPIESYQDRNGRTVWWCPARQAL